MKSDNNTTHAKNLDVSILIPTFNRAEDLRETLNKMKAVRRDSISAEFVIIDNGSTDDTKSVVESFADHLPIRYLFEPRPGKNCALNFALDNAPMGSIVVFTDDDIDPDPNWLIAIVDTCKRWPDHSVFGGRINVVWPHDNIPAWANDPHIQGLGFTAHHISDQECIYDKRKFPFGPNVWFRRHVFANGLRFEETIGPRPKNRIMGSETSLLFKLRDRGYEFVYAPHSIVGHRIKPDVLTATGIWKRAYRLGRSMPHLRGLPSRDQLKYNPFIWQMHICFILIRQIFSTFAVFISPFSDQRIIKIVHIIQNIGKNVETLRMVHSEKPYRKTTTA